MKIYRWACIFPFSGSRTLRKRRSEGWAHEFSVSRILLLVSLLFGICLPRIAIAQEAAAPATSPLSKNIIWYETPVAEVTVGFDQATNKSIQRSFYLAYVGPENALAASPGVSMAKAMEIARDCAETVHPLRTQLQNQLALADYQSQKLAPSDRVAKTISTTNAALLYLAGARSGQFFACVRGKGLPSLIESDFYLALVQRNCTDTDCQVSKSRRRLSDDEQTKYFAALFEWMASKIAIEHRTATGNLIRLDTLTNSDASATLKADVARAREVNKWLPDPTLQTRAAQFALLVEQVRASRRQAKNAPRVAAFAPVSIGLSRTDVVTVADALSPPVEAYAIATQIGAQLANVSNETARSQIFDCRYFRGKTDLGQIAQCSGLTLTEAELGGCLAGSLCKPSLPATAQLESILSGAPMTFDQMASSNPLPRNIPGDLTALKAKYDTCLGKDADQNALNLCLADQLMNSSPELRAMSPCMKKAGAMAQTACALQATNGEAAKALNCVANKFSRESVSCVVTGYLPEREQKVFYCLSAPPASRAATCGQLLGGDAGKLAECARQSTDRIAIASCAVGSRLDEPTRSALNCATSSGSVQAAAICIAGTRMPPRLARQIGCITQSQGSPAAAGVCIATSSMNLTPEQQLALQCLASSGGQPYVFVACFGGQLTLREMIQCRGKKFGEGNCFGENNEFQKLAKALTGKMITSNSVIGQIMTVNIAPAAYVCAAAQPAIDNVMAGFSASVENAKSGLEALVKGDFGGVAEAAVEEVKNGLKRTICPFC